MDAVIHRAGEGELHEMGPNAVLIKATSDDTAGTFFLSLRVRLPPGLREPVTRQARRG